MIGNLISQFIRSAFFKSEPPVIESTKRTQLWKAVRKQVNRSGVHGGRISQSHERQDLKVNSGLFGR